MEKTLTRAQKVEEKKHRIYILKSTLRDSILIHTEDNSSLKEVNGTTQMHILYLLLSTLLPVDFFALQHYVPYGVYYIRHYFCLLPLWRVHEIKRMYLASRTHGLFIT
jgi:hypothetical protein